MKPSIRQHAVIKSFLVVGNSSQATQKQRRTRRDRDGLLRPTKPEGSIWPSRMGVKTAASVIGAVFCDGFTWSCSVLVRAASKPQQGQQSWRAISTCRHLSSTTSERRLGVQQ